MNNPILRRLVVSPALVIALGTAAQGPLLAQGALRRAIDRLADAPPFDRATWGILVQDDRGRTLYARNADRLFIPASATKLVVAAAASVLLPESYRAVTSVYATGPLAGGVLDGDLVVYGRGDPTFSTRCYGTDTLAAGACDSAWARIDALADSLLRLGVRHVTGALVGDGSFFEPTTYHPGWDTYDVNWWYASPVSGLGFNDNSVDFSWKPGPTVAAPAVIRWEPDLGIVQFENRTETVAAGARRTLDFFRVPGTVRIWAEGAVPIDDPGRTEHFAFPDPNLYFAAALRSALAERGVSVAGPTRATTDSMTYALARRQPALAEYDSRPLGDIVFPILNGSQNWFAEMLLKALGRAVLGQGSWNAGLQIERRFLVDSVGIDSTAVSLEDGSGLSKNDLLTPRAFVQLLRYMRGHPRGANFLRALPRSGAPGSLHHRFLGTPLEGRVVAKTGTVYHVNTLCGYIERPNGRVLTFSIMANNHTGRMADVLARIDSIVAQAAK